MSHRKVDMVVVHAAFFLSGFASLACEVVWFKLFGLVLGNGTFSASAVVACFFVGLGFGSIAIGRIADRWTRPLLAYGVLELCLAATSLLTTMALVQWHAWIGWFRPLLALESSAAAPVQLLIAGALLAPPTMLMGSTLPVLSRWLVRQRAELSARVGLLYAVNTFGAALGCAAVGFLLVGWIGVQKTAMLGSLIYAAIGLAALWLARSEVPTVPDEAEPQGRAPTSVWLLAAVFATSGFVSVSYEILWFRLLSYFSVNTVYVFAALLSVYLLGLVAGALLAARWLAPRRDRHLVWFARLQLAIAVTGVLTLAMIGATPHAMLLLGVDFLSAGGLLRLLIITGVTLALPTTLIGITFPLASEITVERLSGLGSRIGLVYGLNTVVGALGSLLTGFVLIPLLGSQVTAAALALLNVALFGVIWASHDEVRREPGIGREAALVLAGVLLMQGLLGPSYLRDRQTAYNEAEVLAFHETPDGTFVLVQHREEEERYQQVVVNGTSYANNRPPGHRYMALLAHLPMLLEEDLTSALVICVGTGTTVGAASLHDRADAVWAVDLTREIFRLAPYFAPRNQSFHENPRVRQVVADGRHFLTVTDERFDVLTFEPPPPLEAGVANLYSREFYALARMRMRPGSTLAQWIPFHQGYENLQKQLVRTTFEVFPHVSLWVADQQEGILIASDAPLRIDRDALARRMAEPDIAADLHEIGIDSPEDLLATFVAADDALLRYLGDAPPLSDDLPTVERFLAHEFDAFAMSELLAYREPVEAYVVGALDPLALDRSRAATDALWEASDHYIASDHAAAGRSIARGLRFAPDNVYLRYRQVEFRRAELAARGE